MTDQYEDGVRWEGAPEADRSDDVALDGLRGVIFEGPVTIGGDFVLGDKVVHDEAQSPRQRIIRATAERLDEDREGRAALPGQFPELEA